MSRFMHLSTHHNSGHSSNRFIKTVDNAEVSSYEQAEKFLGAAWERRIASNVSIVRLDVNRTGVKLYDTIIICYHRKVPGKPWVFWADNGGFWTRTTATRCCQFGPKGYHFYHYKKKLLANGHQCGVGQWLPVFRRKPTCATT